MNIFKMKINKNTLFLIAASAVALYGYWQNSRPNSAVAPMPAVESSTRFDNTAESNRILQQAFEHKRSKLQVQGSGIVSKTLPDDNKGSRHQRFILKLDGGQTLLIAHNIDLAPRIPGLKKSDVVEFYGQYEWSEQGGVIHWTHHDPQKRHADGWLKHRGQLYQ